MVNDNLLGLFIPTLLSFLREPEIKKIEEIGNSQPFLGLRDGFFTAHAFSQLAVRKPAKKILNNSHKDQPILLEL